MDIIYFVLCTTGYFAFHSHTIITHSGHEKKIVFTWCFHVHFFQLNGFFYALLLFTLFLSAAFIYFRAHTHTHETVYHRIMGMQWNINFCTIFSDFPFVLLVYAVDVCVMPFTRSAALMMSKTVAGRRESLNAWLFSNNHICNISHQFIRDAVARIWNFIIVLNEAVKHNSKPIDHFFSSVRQLSHATQTTASDRFDEWKKCNLFFRFCFLSRHFVWFSFSSTNCFELNCVFRYSLLFPRFTLHCVFCWKSFQFATKMFFFLCSFVFDLQFHNSQHFTWNCWCGTRYTPAEQARDWTIFISIVRPLWTFCFTLNLTAMRLNDA